VVAVIGAIIAGLTYSARKRDAQDVDYQKSMARWNARAKIADTIALDGVPPDGPLAMLDRDPDLRGEALFSQHCASCHLLGDLGDPKKFSATTLDGWGTDAWVRLMLHDPDAASRFGKTPYKGEMPSQDTPPKDEPDKKVLSKDEMSAVAQFLAAQADEVEIPRDKENVAAFAKIVSELCTACHLYKGEGDDGDKGLAPELAHWGTLAWMREQIANPATKETYRENALSPELKGHMPHFDEDLSAADIDIVARWTRTRARANAPKP